MPKSLPHYKDAATRRAIPDILKEFGYVGEVMWWHFLELQHQNEVEPLNLADRKVLADVGAYMLPLHGNPVEREALLMKFFDFCSVYDTDGLCLIDPNLWQEKKAWNPRAHEKASKRKKAPVEIPAAINMFTDRMVADIQKLFPYQKKTPKWNKILLDLIEGGVTLEEVSKVWTWLQTSNDKQAEFWRQQVRSTSKLKEKWSVLHGFSQMSRPSIPRSIFDRGN